MAPKTISQNEENLKVVHPQDVLARKTAKALQDLKDEEKRSLAEINANEIFGGAFATWRPGNRKLRLSFQRQRTSAASQSTLTASNMSCTNLSMSLGWEFIEIWRMRPETRTVRGVAADIQPALSRFQEAITPSPGKELFLPKEWRVNSLDDIRFDSSTLGLDKLDITGQLRRFSSGLFSLFSEGKISGYQPEPLSTIKWYSRPPKESITPDFFTAQSSKNEVALSILLHLCPVGNASSELVVERTMGSFLHWIFDAIGTLEQTIFTSGRRMVMFGALSVFGSHPHPDLVVRNAKLPHRLFDPVCLIGEAKTEETNSTGTVAQLATSAHSTLALFVLAWCMHNPVNSQPVSKFPDWAVLFGITYTEKPVDVYAFYPFDGLTLNEKTWNFSSVKMHTFHDVMAATPRVKLQFMHAMGVIQRQAIKSGAEMSALLTKVFDAKNGEVKIKEAIIQKHTPNESLRRVSVALTESVKRWEALSKNA